jgi:OmpA-OmpF porin, OOP family
MRRPHLAAAVLAAASCLAGASHAQVYAGTSIAVSRIDIDCSRTSSCDRYGNAWKLFAGYMHTPYLGAEAVYYDQGRSRVSSSDAGVLSGDISGSGLGLYGVAVVPFDEFSMHVKVGAFSSRTRFDAHPTASGPRTSAERHAAFAWGFGGAWAFSPRVSLRVDLERLGVKLRDEPDHLDMVSASVLYRF